MVEQLKAKWCEDLEELLQCPVCFERVCKPVLQCFRGHNICSRCKPQMQNCPMCKSAFSESRNFLAEDLSVKLNDIKASLLMPPQRTNASRKISGGGDSDTKKKLRPPPPAAKGVFPCRIGNCTVKVPHSRMLPHIRWYHNTKLNEITSLQSDSYKEIWEIEYCKGTHFTCALHLSRMSLFFVNVNINDNGDLFGIVQVLNTNTIGKEFTYELTVAGDQHTNGFKSNPISCRTDPAHIFRSDDRLVVRRANMERLTSENQFFTCTVCVTRLPETNANGVRPVISMMNSVAF